jgi:UrcA family protein
MCISSQLLTAAAMFAVLALPAHADAASAADSIRGRSVVQYGDLDVATERDARILLQRIELAATKACGGHPTFSTYTGRLDGTFEECRSGAIRRAVKKLGAPTVTRIYTEDRSQQS